MTTNKIGEWLTIATNIAVLAGIVALAYEIGQNTRQLRAQDHRLPFPIFKLTRVKNGDSLTEADVMRIRASAEVAILKWHWEYGQFIDGSLSLTELPVNAYRAAYRGDYGVRLTGIPEAWLSLKDQLRPDFVAWMEANVVNH